MASVDACTSQVLPPTLLVAAIHSPLRLPLIQDMVRRPYATANDEVDSMRFELERLFKGYVYKYSPGRQSAVAFARGPLLESLCLT